MFKIQNSFSFCRRPALLIVVMLSAYAVPPTNANATPTAENANITVMLRQLNALEETAQRSAQTSADTSQRYSFDYQRLAEDIARIRHGINDYLSPHRAQPRDPVELSGSYTMEARKP